jgi:DNA-binding transcriptional LysR family regulator
MDLGDLTIFRTVAESGGITRAAERLHRVPSNVTTRIGQLESDLGVKLFLREGKKMRLSPAGAILLERAHRLLDLASEAREAVHEDTPRGLLRLGAFESTASVWLPGPLSAFHRRYPQIALELHTRSLQDMAAGLAKGDLDVALLAGVDDDERFERIPLYDDELVLVAPKNKDPLAKQRTSEDFVLLAFEDDCPQRRQIEAWIVENIRPPTRVVSLSSNHALLGCVAAGMGIGMMPVSVLPGFPGHRHLNIHRLPKDVARKRISITWRRGMRSARLDALADALLEAAQKSKSSRK